MADPGREADDTEEQEEHEDAENGGEEYEVERLVTRAEAATVLRRLADGVANGTVELGGEGVTAPVPERLELELEYEREPEGAELEVELEWPVVDGEPVAPERKPEARDREDAGTTETEEGGESAAEADADGPVDELVGSGRTASNARFELYRDRADEWRWRLVHDNGNIIADSGEGYARKATARNGLESVVRNAPDATVVTLDD